MKQRLDQRQVQKLILAPALQQAIKLLPLTNLELIEIIDTELSQNPLIELEEESFQRPVKDANGKSSKEKGELEKQLEKMRENSPDPEAEEGGRADFEAHFQEYFGDNFRPSVVGRKEIPSIENFLTRTPSLWDHLNWQANLTFFDPKDREISQQIIGNINEDGYLSAPLEEIACQCQVSVERVNEVREKIKIFDPVGVGSLDLREALLAQMGQLQMTNETTKTLVNQYLPLLEKSDFTQLAKALQIPLSEVKFHIEIIKALDPAPGRKYSQERTFYVVPDILVTKEGNEYKVALNDEGLPRLRINSYYRKLLAKTSVDNPEAHRFLKEKMKKALWFLRSLNQRDQTIFKVAKYIVDKQQEFLEKGLDYIKPLTLMEIAQEIGVHESTVGRVVANKYLTTPRGVFPLKYFFHKSLVGDFGEEISSLRIKERIKKLVESEDRNRPLSDIEIGELLAKENLKIARRTIAKYRKQLKILPSHIRKRKFVMEASS